MLPKIKNIIKRNWHGRDIEIEIHNYDGISNRLIGETTLKIDGCVFLGGIQAEKNEPEDQLIEKSIRKMEDVIKRYASGEIERGWQLRKKNGSKWAETVIPDIQRRQLIAQWLVKTFKL